MRSTTSTVASERREPLILTVSCLLLGVSLAGLAAVQAQARLAPISCQVAHPNELPEFTSSGAWYRGRRGEELLLLDNQQRTVLTYSPQGVARGSLSEDLAVDLDRLLPKYMAVSGEGLFLQIDNNRFGMVDRQFALHPFRVKAAPEAAVVSKVYAMTLAGQDVVGFADVRSDDKWQQGFIRFPKDHPERFIWLVPEISNEERVFYRLSLPFVASIKDVAYILRMENQINLYRHNRDDDRVVAVTAFANHYKQLAPQLPRFVRPEDSVQIMASVERSSMPVGVIGWSVPPSSATPTDEARNFLGILLRNREGGEVQWSLMVIEPDDDRFLGEIPIRIKSPHLMVVPGEDYWAFVAKSSLSGLQRQPVTALYFVDAKELQLRRGLPAAICNN